MLSYCLSLALRSLRRNPALTALMIIAIGVGIGASMTTLTALHILSGDSLPGRSAQIFFPQVDPMPADLYNTHHPLVLGLGQLATLRPASVPPAEATRTA